MRRAGIEYPAIVGIVAAFAVVLFAQVLEGASVRSLWQPTAALVVFGGTAAAVMVSFPLDLVLGTLGAVFRAFATPPERLDVTLDHVLTFAHLSRRKGLIAIENEIDQASDPFLREALALAADGTNVKTARHILEIESGARHERAEALADVLETAAGYAPTLGILGAVLGLIHVMESLSEPSKLGSGIAVAFVATVYGVASANLLLLPLATKLRGRSRHAALNRELIVEGVIALQDGMHPRLIEQKLQGFLQMGERPRTRRRVA